MNKYYGLSYKKNGVTHYVFHKSFFYIRSLIGEMLYLNITEVHYLGLVEID